MNDTRTKRVADKIRQAVKRNRQREEAAKPCPECAQKPLSDNPMSRVRLITELDEHTCARCHDVAAESGFQIVEMVLPRGLDAT
jgi:hypothetical protein